MREFCKWTRWGFSIVALALGFQIGFGATVQAAEINLRDYDLNEASADQIMKAFRYVEDQNLRLDTIARDYPDLASQAMAAKKDFADKFGEPDAAIIAMLTAVLPSERAKAVIDNMNLRVAATQGAPLPRDSAERFISRVKDRANGTISSPEIKIFLALKYASDPAAEMTDGHVQTYSTKDHSKAGNLKLTLDLPQSWRSAEGGLPLIVHKWGNQDGSGEFMITLMVEDVDEADYTRKTVEKLVASHIGWKPEVKGERYLGGAAVIIDNRNFIRSDTIVKPKQYDQKIPLYGRAYATVYDGRFVQLSCSSKRGETDEERASAFEKLKAICDQVALSILFQ